MPSEEIIKPEKPIISCLTPLTGVTKADLDKGISLNEAIKNKSSFSGRFGDMAWWAECRLPSGTGAGLGGGIAFK